MFYLEVGALFCAIPPNKALSLGVLNGWKNKRN